MSLLQGVLKSNTEDIENSLKNIRLNGRSPSYEDKDDSDDDKLINVVRAVPVSYQSHLTERIADFASWNSSTYKAVVTYERCCIAISHQDTAALIIKSDRSFESVSNRTITTDIFKVIY